MKKSKFAVFAMLVLYMAYQFTNWVIYKDLKVTNYSQLMNKAKYGQITQSDLRAGSFDLIENSLCIMVNDDLTNECTSKFQSTKEVCALEIFSNKNLKGFNQDQTDNLIRLFNVCRQSSLHSAT